MKNIFTAALLFCTLISFGQNNSTLELKERAERVREELLSKKPLPKEIMIPAWCAAGAPPGHYSFYYYTTRMEDNKMDSVMMSIDVIDEGESFGHLFFVEMHTILGNDTPTFNGNEGKSYIYSLNRQGLIDWAYYTNPPTAESTEEHTADGSVLYSMNQHIVEINTDSKSQERPVIPNEKTREKYMEKLKVTLDEVEKILFDK